jgi:hypothetical protein
MIYKKYKPRTVKNLVKRSYFLILSGQWSSLGNYAFVEILNILNQNNIFYGKKNIVCPLCNYKNHSFIHLCNSLEISLNSACQNCDSRSRHRGLYFLYRKYLLNSSEKKILHFAPEKSLKKAIKSFADHQYFTTDLNMIDVNFPREDVQALKFKDNSFDIILINHVLEHVPNDNKAMSEISRTLKDNGCAIITIPGNWKKMKTKIFDKPNKNGHYRDYGFEVINKLQNHFRSINKVNLFRFDGKKHAIKNLEIAFICKK